MESRQVSLSLQSLSLLRSPRLLSLSLSLSVECVVSDRNTLVEKATLELFLCACKWSKLVAFFVKVYSFFISSVSQQPNPCFGYLCGFVFLGFLRL